MSLFGRNGEQKRDYRALIGPGDKDVLQLTADMKAHDQSPLVLQDEQITKFTATDMDSARSKLQSKINRQDGQLKSTREQLNALNAELAELKAEEIKTANNVQAEIETLKTECEDLKVKNRSGRRRIRERNRELCERQEELAELQGSAMMKIADYKSELFQKSGKLDKQRAQIRALESELSETRDELATSEFKRSDLQDRMTIQSLGSSSQTRKVEKLTRENEQHTNTIKRLKETLKNARDKLLQMRKREEEALAENAIVTAQNRALSMRQEELLAELEMIQQSTLKKGTSSRIGRGFLDVA